MKICFLNVLFSLYKQKLNFAPKTVKILYKNTKKSPNTATLRVLLSKNYKKLLFFCLKMSGNCSFYIKRFKGITNTFMLKNN